MENLVDSHTPSLWFKKNIQNLLVRELSIGYAQEPQRNCTFMNSALEGKAPKVPQLVQLESGGGKVTAMFVSVV